MAFETARLKVERASKHIADMSKIIREQKPFAYILETNANTGERATFAKKNESAVNQVALVCGDAVHNLRSALDHAYVEVISPFCHGVRELRNAQFPFSETAARLDEAIKNRLAQRAGQWLVDAITALKPHGEPGGNELLYLIHEIDVVDKHRLLIPAGDYTMLSTDILLSQALDFPPMGGAIGFGSNRRDLVWRLSPSVLSAIRNLIPPSGILEQELNVPVQIVFAIRPHGQPREFVQTLHLMTNAAKVAIAALQKP